MNYIVIEYGAFSAYVCRKFIQVYDAMKYIEMLTDNKIQFSVSYESFQL